MDLANENAKLKAELDILRAKHAVAHRLSFKVSEKGALSVYGMGRFPVTLYREQWERLIANLEPLKGFMAQNLEKLSVKA